MQAKPFISVVVPVYNGAFTIGGCLQALLASRYQRFEVIVVDDGSTDDTAQIASHHPVRVIRLPENMGSARAKNEGAQRARGEVLFFTDADIHVPPEGLSYVAEDLRDERVDGVVGLLARTCPYENFASQFKNLWMHFTYLRQPRRVGLFFTSAAAIRRDIFVQEGGFDPSYRGSSITEDIEFGQRLLSHGYRVVMDKRLTVEHQKHYTAGEVLGTDLLRARGLTLTWVRNRFQPEKRAHYASVPWYFGAGVLCMGIATLLAVLALPFWDARLLAVGGLFAVLALLLNGPFLLALGRWRGFSFLLKSVSFLALDLYASGLGIAWGFLDYCSGRRY